MRLYRRHVWKGILNIIFPFPLLLRCWKYYFLTSRGMGSSAKVTLVLGYILGAPLIGGLSETTLRNQIMFELWGNHRDIADLDAIGDTTCLYFFLNFSDVGVITPADCPAGHYCEGGNEDPTVIILRSNSFFTPNPFIFIIFLHSLPSLFLWSISPDTYPLLFLVMIRW